MTGNIDEPLPIVIDKANSFSFNSYARGYHAYMKIWNPVDRAVWFAHEKLIILMITTMFPSFVIRMLWAIFHWI